MRVLGTKAFLMAAALSLTACYVDELDDRAPSESGDGMLGDGLNNGACRLSTKRGCFEGHVISKKDLLVDGKQFFNADDLAARFHELVIVQSAGVDLAEGDTYELELTTPVDNQSFVQGFEFYLTGEAARAGKVGSQGNFQIHDLPEGSYELRVQRSVRFTVVERPAAQVEPAPVMPKADEALPEQPKPEQLRQADIATKSYCATLYADAVVEVARGRRLRDTFGEFKLHVSDHECAAGAGSSKLTLRK